MEPSWGCQRRSRIGQNTTLNPDIAVCQDFKSIIGQQLTSRGCQNIRMSESYISVRIWHVHLWSDSDIYKTLLMSPVCPGDVRPQSPSLVRMWPSQDISDIHMCRMSKGHQNTSLTSVDCPGTSEFKVIVCLESDFYHSCQFQTSYVILWHQILTSWRCQDLTLIGHYFRASVICQDLVLTVPALSSLHISIDIRLIQGFMSWINNYLMTL